MEPVALCYGYWVAARASNPLHWPVLAPPGPALPWAAVGVQVPAGKRHRQRRPGQARAGVHLAWGAGSGDRIKATGRGREETGKAGWTPPSMLYPGTGGGVLSSQLETEVMT